MKKASRTPMKASSRKTSVTVVALMRSMGIRMTMCKTDTVTRTITAPLQQEVPER